MANCDSKHNSYQQLILQPKNKTTRNKKRCIKTNDSMMLLDLWNNLSFSKNVSMLAVFFFADLSPNRWPAQQRLMVAY